MSDTYQPIIGSDEEFGLAPTSTKNMEALNKLQLRAPFFSDREQIAQNYGYDNVEEAMEDMGAGALSPPRFWEQAALVIFEGLDEIDDDQGVDFAEARRAVGKFNMAGNEEYAELMNGLLDSETTRSN